MNGNWYPWGRDRESPSVYRAAWRRVVGIFRHYHADNVSWIWSPYVSQTNSMAFSRYFPGDKWVDWVALDGFNYNRRGKWKSFAEIFGSSYRVITRLSSRPVMIAETGSAQAGDRKAAWVTHLLRRELPRFGRIRSLIWFDSPFNGIDASVDSSPSALRALRHAARLPRFRSDRGSLLHLSGLLR